MIKETIGVVIVTHNPPVNAIEREIETLLGSKFSFKIFIIDSSDNSNPHLMSYIQSLCYNDNISYYKVCNSGFDFSLNYGVNKIRQSTDARFIMVLEDDVMSLSGLVEVMEMLQEVVKGDSDVVILGDKEIVPGPHKLVEITKGYFGSSTFIARSECPFTIPHREEFFMDYDDFDFQFNIRKHGGNLYVTSWPAITKLPIGRGEFPFLVQPLWRNFLKARNSTVLLKERKISFLLYVREYIMSIPGFLINIWRYGFFTFMRVMFRGFSCGISNTFSIDDIMEIRHTAKK